MKHQSSCSCGEVKFASKTDPVRVSICHCFDCQKRTGSVFGVQARFNRSDVTFSGKTTEWVRITDDGEKIYFNFCTKCGSMVFWFIETLPDLVITAVGNFSDPDFPAPKIEVFAHRKHHWIDFSKMPIEHHGIINQ